MVSQHQLQDTARQPTGQELEAHGIALIQLIFIMAIIGLVLLTVAIVTTRVTAAMKVTCTATATSSTARTLVFAPPFQSRLRSLRSNNQRINHRLSSKIKRGGET